MADLTDQSEQVVEFWYEFASTYSYPAAMRVEAVAARAHIAVRWQPFLLGPIFAELGWSTSPFNLQPAKGAYMWHDLARSCARLRLDFRRPEPFPQNGLLAARVATALPDDGTRARFSRAVYRAEFADGRIISEPEVIAALLAEQGLDAEALLLRAADPAVKQTLREQTDAAKRHGIFGAPTWRTPDGELFWGNDRLEEALDWVRTIAHGRQP